MTVPNVLFSVLHTVHALQVALQVYSSVNNAMHVLPWRKGYIGNCEGTWMSAFGTWKCWLVLHMFLTEPCSLGS